MKIPNLSKPRQGGMATIVMLAILSIMCLYITANIRTLNRLEREIKLVDQRQQRRLAIVTAGNRSATNSVAAQAPSAASQTAPQ